MNSVTMKRAALWSLGISALAVALSTAVPAAAQSADGSGQDNAAAGQDIVVTGSRIRRPDYASANPILSLGAEQLQESGNTNVTNFLTGYPALVGSQTSNQNSGDRAGIGETGLNLLDLRNLGRARTLVLVDGRRHVAAVPGEQSVDINTIPSDLIEGIDVLTGGASAIYGADGVTGVVNFRLKRDFQGLTLHAQSGITPHGDAGQYLLTATAGTNFGGGKGNVALSYEYGKDNRLQTRDRPRLSGLERQVFVLNQNDPNDDPNLPDRIPLGNVRYGLSSGAGAVDIDGDYVPEFVGTGELYDNGVDLGEGYVLGGSSTLVSRYGNDLLPDIRRHVVNGIAHFDVNDGLTLYAEAKYANVRSFSLAQPSFEYGTFIEADNPYLPANIRAAIDPTIGGVLVNRDNFDLGQRGEDILRQTYRTVIGVRGDIGISNLRYDLSYVWGRTTVRSRYIGDIYNDRFFAAVDAVRDPATGQITCRVNLQPGWTPNQPYESGRTVLDPTTFQPGQCRPINLLGEGNSDPAGIAFITAPTTDYSSIAQHVISGSITGDTESFLKLPGGPIGFAVGGEYRKEISHFDPDPIEQQGLTYTNVLNPTTGRFSVKEVFGEVNVPLLKDKPFFHNLEVGGAVRYSDYSTIGSTTTWKANAIYAPLRDISFRGTYAVAIRAPNIGELYGGNSQTFEFFNDPCLPANLNNGTQYRAANCATLLSGLGATPATYGDGRTFNIPGTQGGNPNLTEEKATTWTAGVVLSPQFLRGFNVSVDWYDIKLTNAINQVAAQELSELCVDQPSLSNPFCASITRQNGASGTAAAGNIVGFTVGPQNVAAFRTAGLDVNLTWRVRTDRLGTFSLRGFGNYLHRLSFIGTPGADPTNQRGTAYAPKYQATVDLTWSKGPFTLNYGWSWFDKTLRYSVLTFAGDPDYVDPQYKYFHARSVHDIYASVNVQKGFQLYGGVNNLFDQQSDIGSFSYPNESIGRRLFIGARVNFGGK